MKKKNELAAPCGLYCGVCGIYIAHKNNDAKFKERLQGVYWVGADEIKCNGCLSDVVFKYCLECPIRSCAASKGIEGCHQCNDFPCKFIDAFPLPVGKKVILRAIPTWRKLGTAKWMEQEEELSTSPPQRLPMKKDSPFLGLPMHRQKYGYTRKRDTSSIPHP
jgi:hypothetical protein